MIHSNEHYPLNCPIPDSIYRDRKEFRSSRSNAALPINSGKVEVCASIYTLYYNNSNNLMKSKFYQKNSLFL